jgi:pimeloyl-ACP methyl ester carboxylesterase
MDMAKRSVGPLSFVLRDRFDNRARFDELAARNPSPAVHLFHGTRDEIVPFEMSEVLVQRYPGATLHAIENLDHNWLLDAVDEKIVEIMTSAGTTDDEAARE